MSWEHDRANRLADAENVFPVALRVSYSDGADHAEAAWASLEADERVAGEDALSTVRAMLGAERADAAWSEGQAMTLEQAVV